MKQSLFRSHTATLLQYIGIGLISGAISHGFFSGFRSLVTAVIGVGVFVIWLTYERYLVGSKVDLGRVLLIGIIFSISTAMVAGGIQHFLDSPWRSVWIIPLWYCISLIAFREKEQIKNSFIDIVWRALSISWIIFVVWYLVAQYVPMSYYHHQDFHPKNSEVTCQMMPGMKGCEDMDHHAGSPNSHTSDLDTSKHGDHGMDHGSMVTSEESFIVNMIPHHQEAVDTARLVLARGDSAELKKLAQAIITAQEKEIAMMQKWSKDWNYSTVKSSYQNMMGDGTKLSGKALDTWFLQGMIMHHMGAVQMADSVLKLNTRKEVSDFARDVIRVQNAEIMDMKILLWKDI